ncbi:MAG TPA: hypothetical protein VGL15_12215 [Vicinamibacteria bacterium]|jgi:hypothetical protein
MKHDASGCRDVPFAATYALDEADEVALEDYARVLTGAAEAEVLRGGTEVAGLHLCGTGAPEPAVLRDLEDFARELAAARRYGRRWA